MPVDETLTAEGVEHVSLARLSSDSTNNHQGTTHPRPAIRQMRGRGLPRRDGCVAASFPRITQEASWSPSLFSHSRYLSLTLPGSGLLKHTIAPVLCYQKPEQYFLSHCNSHYGTENLCARGSECVPSLQAYPRTLSRTH